MRTSGIAGRTLVADNRIGRYRCAVGKTGWRFHVCIQSNQIIKLGVPDSYPIAPAIIVTLDILLEWKIINQKP